ncbi:hypothetical protein VP01_400g8 [Puccinia sorghi]|uniref:Integrase catalytic domain-containing protein n=1 Tax=Puccinia sorghi TaxID=27349 RepID=A0A0L6URZ2_9BASI|nr:hypothetical protein VP01_400g8 [Puccinia sorghi]
MTSMSMSNFSKIPSNCLKTIKLLGLEDMRETCPNFRNQEEKSYLSSSEHLHKSLGHVSYHRIRQKLGIPLWNIASCEACALSKITRASFKSKHEKASRPFEELHLDLIGPISPSSRNARRFGYFPSVLHSNKGGEFIGSSMEAYCKEHLIKSRTSNPYPPQKNGLAERHNRTVIESLRNILTDSKLSKRYSSDVASQYFLNQIPPHRSSKSPYELFKGRSIPIHFFRPIDNPVSFLIQPQQSGAKIYPKKFRRDVELLL